VAEPQNTSFGELLRQYRIAAELSQEALAERAHMSARGVSDLERGARTKPYRGTIELLADALRLDAAERSALEGAAQRVREPGPARAGREPVPRGEVLLTTKLSVPPARTRLVARPRLLDRLETGVQGPLTLLAAPAGAGKTTLLSAWRAGAAGRSVPVGWVSLDVSDNDPIRFWRYVFAALKAAGVDVGADRLHLLHPPQPAPIEVVLTSVLNTLGAQTDDLVLVLDDYHLIENDSIQNGITFLLEYLPSRLHMVLSSRTDPPLPLARLRAGGRITEVRVEHLRFSREEAAEFLIDIMGLELTAEDIEALERRTEGWIAGLQLAALSLQRRPGTVVSDFITSFAGSHRHVIDYLTDEVLARVPGPVQLFLLHTSILDRLSAPLCAFVMDEDTTGEAVTASRDLLAELERTNFFLLALDEQREWFRYHQLFAEALRHRFRRLEPDHVDEAYLRASRWGEEQGLFLEAVKYALDGGEFERAATLIEHMQSTLKEQSADETLWRLLDRLPDQVLARHAILCVARGWGLVHGGPLDEGERWLDAAETALQIELGREGSQNLRGEIAAARAFAASFRGDAIVAIAWAEAALRDLDADNLLTRGWVYQALGRAYRGKGELAQAIESYAEAASITRRSGNAHAVMRAMFGQSQMERAHGQLGRAIETCRQAIAWSAERGHAYPGVGMMHLLLANMLRERNELDAALRLAKEGREFCAQMEPDLTVPVFLRFVLARIEQAYGHLDAALDVVHEAQEILHRAEDPTYSQSDWQAFEAELLLQQGNLSGAAAYAERAVQEKRREGVAVEAASRLRSREYIALIQIQVLIAQGRSAGDPRPLQSALALLDEVRRRVGARDRDGDFSAQVTARILEALAHHALGEAEQARVSLEAALALGQPEGYVRLFADEGEPMATLLREVPVDATRRDYVATLLAAVHSTQ
jgi:LuxR family maltose regulon positive regulatory protein